MNLIKLWRLEAKKSKNIYAKRLKFKSKLILELINVNHIHPTVKNACQKISYSPQAPSYALVINCFFSQEAIFIRQSFLYVCPSLPQRGLEVLGHADANGHLHVPLPSTTSHVAKNPHLTVAHADGSRNG